MLCGKPPKNLGLWSVIVLLFFRLARQQRLHHILSINCQTSPMWKLCAIGKNSERHRATERNVIPESRACYPVCISGKLLHNLEITPRQEERMSCLGTTLTQGCQLAKRFPVTHYRSRGFETWHNGESSPGSPSPSEPAIYTICTIYLKRNKAHPACF